MPAKFPPSIERLRGTVSAYNLYLLYIASKHWRDVRELVKKRAFNRCERCRGPFQQVHHLTYENLGHENLEDLVGLCDGCHRDAHDLPKLEAEG